MAKGTNAVSWPVRITGGFIVAVGILNLLRWWWGL